MYTEERWHYREIKNTDRQSLAVAVYAALALAKETGTKICVGDYNFRLDEFYWWVVVKVYTVNPLPFKELLDKPESEQIAYLNEMNERWLKQTGRFRA